MFRLQIFYKNNHKGEKRYIRYPEIPAIATITSGIIIALTMSFIHSLSISLLSVSYQRKFIETTKDQNKVTFRGFQE